MLQVENYKRNFVNDRMLRYLIVVLFLSTVFAVDHNCQQDESIVDTQNGCISGLVEDTVRRFLSIPFAEPPVKKKTIFFLISRSDLSDGLTPLPLQIGILMFCKPPLRVLLALKIVHFLLGCAPRKLLKIVSIWML